MKPNFLSAGVLAAFLIALPQLLSGQDRSGELRLYVADASGAAFRVHGTLISQANHFELSFETNPSGEYTAKRLPMGSYKLTLEQAGFAPYTALIEIRSELPFKFSAALAVASITQTVNVKDSERLSRYHQHWDFLSTWRDRTARLECDRSGTAGH